MPTISRISDHLDEKSAVPGQVLGKEMSIKQYLKNEF